MTHRVLNSTVWVVVCGVLAGCSCCVEVNKCCTVTRAPMIDVADARRAGTIEMAMDGAGNVMEVEYHVLPQDAPQAVRDAMDEHFPGGPFTGCEKERMDGKLYWELARDIAGFKTEAMFTPDGKLHSAEIEIGENDVPQAVRDTVANRWAHAPVKAWEVIKDGDQKVVEYHVKLDEGGKALKALLSPGGSVIGLYQEMVAEIEIPLPTN